ncbi:MAG TPA: hypothetical protein DCP37_10110 [Dehalococcoidia bacterium]|mgnify:CR=1 FL=1|nr:hypothetical protein [Dehalococcoidia bacterium]
MLTGAVSTMTCLPGLQVADGVSVVLYVVGALIVLGRAGRLTSAVPSGVFRWGAWVFFAILTLSTLANLASSSNWERFMLGRIALVLALLCLIVARGVEPEH